MSAALIEAARAALRALELRRNLGNSAYDEQAEKAVADLRTALAAAEAQTATVKQSLTVGAQTARVECDACPTSGGCQGKCMKSEAQPVGEPAAYEAEHRDGRKTLPPANEYATFYRDTCVGVRALYAAPQPAAQPLTDNPWRQLYRRAINEANGLTNYVEDRPELSSAERRLSKIEDEARALGSQP